MERTSLAAQAKQCFSLVCELPKVEAKWLQCLALSQHPMPLMDCENKQHRERLIAEDRRRLKVAAHIRDSLRGDIRTLARDFTNCSIPCAALLDLTERWSPLAISPPQSIDDAKIFLMDLGARLAATTYAPETKKTKGKNIDIRIRELIQRNPDAKDWTAERIARELNCSKGTVGASPAWNTIMKARIMAAAERIDDDKPRDRRKTGERRKRR